MPCRWPRRCADRCSRTIRRSLSRSACRRWRQCRVRWRRRRAGRRRHSRWLSSAARGNQAKLTIMADPFDPDMSQLRAHKAPLRFQRRRNPAVKDRVEVERQRAVPGGVGSLIRPCGTGTRQLGSGVGEYECRTPNAHAEAPTRLYIDGGTEAVASSF
jgi:hypothetical protein